MSAGTDMFGDLSDLATALGVLGPDGNISTDFFVDPGKAVSGMLRDGTRRTALLEFLDQVLGAAGPKVTETGETWTPLMQVSDNVELYLVTTTLLDGVSLGVGVRAATTSSPSAEGRLCVPLVVVPPNGPPVFLPGSSSADAVAHLVAELDVGSASLKSVGLEAALPLGPGASGDLAISVGGLQLPGSATPIDLSLDSNAAIGPQLLQVVNALVESELQAVAGTLGPDAKTLLGLFGLAPHFPVPLPLADLASRGMAALQDWLGQVAASEPALQAWFGHLAELVGATVGGGGLSATLSVASGIDLVLGLVIDTDSTGGRRFAPTVAMTASVATGADLELTATLFQAGTGAHPSMTALPSLELHARYGAATGPATILDVTESGVVVQVGALRAGVALDASRRPVFVLAADRVVLGPAGSTTSHDVLDLTSPDALADVGGEAVSSVLAGLISGLGGAGSALSSLFGLSAPSSWTGGGWPAIDAAAFIANPADAWFGFQQSVLALGTQAFADLLSEVTSLLGLPPVANAAGSEVDPWVLAEGAGLALVAWSSGTSPTTLHLGVRWEPAAAQIGGADGPTPSLQMVAEVLGITLPSGAATVGLHVLSSLSLRAGLSTPSGHPVEAALGAATLDIPSVAVTLGWSPANGPSASLDLPGATVTVGATTSPFGLPSTDNAGNLVLPAGLDDHALETLLAGALASSSAPWLPALARALGLGDPSATGETFATLLDDPRRWVAARLRSLLSAADPSVLSDNLGAVADFVASLVGIPAPLPLSPQTPLAPRGTGGPAAVTGSGRPDDPLVVTLQAGPAELDVTVWLEPDGPPVPPAVLTGLLQPTSLRDWLSGTGAALSTSDLSNLLTSAAAKVPGLSGLMAGRSSIAAGWDALVTRCSGGDGLLPGGAPDIPGATTSTLAGVAHQDLPAHLDLTTLTGLPTGARTLFVTGPYVPPWPGTGVPSLDLTTAGLPATAFDTSALAASANAWHVRLPFRDDCPGADAASRAQACADRLSRAISAAATGGNKVLVVAHGPAACGTARLAGGGAAATDVAGLVLLGASASPVPLDVLDQEPAGDALALARRLLPADSSHDGPDLALARSLLDVFGDLLDATHDPSVDLSPPAGLTASTVPVWSVRGSLDTAGLTKSLGALVQAGLGSFEPGTGLPANPGAPAPAAPTTLRAGLSVHVPLPASATTGDPAGISLDVRARLDVGGLALGGVASASPPSFGLDVDLYRANGWLSGGPEGTSPPPGVLRTPSLRRARLSVAGDVTSGQGGARATVTLYEASALGVTRDAWVLGTGGEQLGAETRVLLGRLAAAFTPLPATGPLTALADLLKGLGLADPSTNAPGFGLSADAVQQLLIDPENALKSALASTGAAPALADALRRLLGFAGAGTAVEAAVGPFEANIDFGASPPAVTVSTSGVSLGGGPALAGSARLDTNGAWSGTVSLGPPGAGAFGIPALLLALGPSPSVALAFGSPPKGVPSRITLYPAPGAGQLGGIAEAALAASGAAVLRALLNALRANVLSAPEVQKLDPVLTSLGLLSGAGGGSVAAPTLPFAIFTDPVGYLAQAMGWPEAGEAGTAPATDHVASLLDALRNLLGLAAAPHGQLPLSSTVSLQASAPAAGGLRLALGYSGTEGQLTSAIDAGLTLVPGAAPVPDLDATLGLAGHTANLALSLDGPNLSAKLHTSAGDIALWPNGPGLGSLATTAVQQALPYVLDALHDHAPAPVPAVLEAVRKVLGLGTTNFDAAQLQQLAADPGNQLVSRLVVYGPNALGDLQPILPVLPAPWALSTAGGHLEVSYNDQRVEVRLGGAPSVLTLEASITAALPGVTGASVTLDAILDTTGFRQLTASAQVAPASPLSIGPLSLAPTVEVVVGPAAAPPLVEAGVAVSDGTVRRAALLSFDLSPLSASLVTQTDGVDDPSADPGVVVRHLLVPLAAGTVLHESHVQSLLQTAVGTSTVGGLLKGVLLTDGGDFDTALLALGPSDLEKRLATLVANLAGAVPPINLPDNLQLSFSDGGSRRGVAISVAAGQRADLVQGGDLGVALEVDTSWVAPALSPPGLSLMVLDTSGQAPHFTPPLITMDGVGLRLYRRSGPLLDSVVTIGSVGLFGLLRIDASGPGVTDGGLAIQLADLGVSPGSAAGGSNGVAQGILGNAGKSGGGGDTTPLEPTFSPELALQARQGSPGVAWSLTAGPGNGPWLVHIDRSFGPLHVQDVGFGDDVVNGRVSTLSVMISGGISLAGLNLDVDDLSVTAPWPASTTDHNLTDAAAWGLDLAGLEVSYSGGGVQLAGGLRRRDNPSLPGNPPDYVGVLLAHVGPYGLTAFGGYGQFPSPTGKFTALFVFAAINAPIGGPPVFFVTGLGGGAGINRALVLPTDLDNLATFPLVAALDPNSTLASDPQKAMDLLSAAFPPQQGTFWFAAGVSFTSFALVECVAVVAIEVGNGFMVSLLGLARAALPTAEFALVEIELALMAEFSTSEGVLLVRAQLTDNSYLLTRDCRLTGGFAYASWFGPNPNAGQFVLSIGGYHPSFNRPDYPAVPRVGFRWDVAGCLTITGGCYFALTSEAIMAGASFTAALVLGPLWASLSLGVDAIVYFDPFHFDATGYASIAAGITIDVDLLFGHITVTLSFHLGAQVEVQGPNFHGSASIDLDVTSASISFGDSTDGSTPTLGWDAFASKYLTSGGNKPVLSGAVLSGAITPAGGSPAPDGSAANPWLLVPEFSLSVATTAAAKTAAANVNVTTPVPPDAAGWVQSGFSLDGSLAIAPMGLGAIASVLAASVVSSAGEDIGPISFSAAPAPGLSLALVTAPLPKGVWAAQLPSGTVPTGETITAGTGMTLTATAEVGAGSPQIDYGQVQPGQRQPLPFAAEQTVRPSLDPDAANAATFSADASTDSATVLADAQGYLNEGLFAVPMTPLANATFRRDRVAPPRLALLTDGIAPPDIVPPTLSDIVRPVRPPLDTTVKPPVVTAFMAGFMAGGTAATQRQVVRTTVRAATAAGATRAASTKGVASTAPAPVHRVEAPTVAAVAAALDPALGAGLLRSAPLALQGVPSATGAVGDGLRAADGGPVTSRAAAPREVHARPVLDAASSALLSAHRAALTDGGSTLRPGDVLVMTMPNYQADIDTGAVRPTLAVAGDAAVRVVALSALGEVLVDQTSTQGTLEVPPHSARLVAWCVGGDAGAGKGASVAAGATTAGAVTSGLDGWAATDRLPYVGAGVTLGRHCVVSGLAAPRRHQARAEAGYQLVAGPARSAQVVRTLLPSTTTVVVVSLDAAQGADVAGLTLGLDGATRAADAVGAPKPPVVVSAHGRAHLLYDVVPVPPAAGAASLVPPTVSVAVGTDPRWSVSGVMGATTSAALLASRLAATGAGDLLAPLVSAPTGSAHVRFASAPPPAPPSPAPSMQTGGAK